jgi:hypothetical protein
MLTINAAVFTYPLARPSQKAYRPQPFMPRDGQTARFLGTDWEGRPRREADTRPALLSRVPMINDQLISVWRNVGKRLAIVQVQDLNWQRQLSMLRYYRGAGPKSEDSWDGRMAHDHDRG